jgi:GGDEF domain-containing protein
MFRLQGVSALNENAGLHAGDKVFVRFAELLREFAGDLAQIGRAGTVGFLVIFPAWGKGSAETWLGLARMTIEERLRAETGCGELWLHTKLVETPADAADFRDLVTALGIRLD